MLIDELVTEAAVTTKMLLSLSSLNPCRPQLLPYPVTTIYHVLRYSSDSLSLLPCAVRSLLYLISFLKKKRAPPPCNIAYLTDEEEKRQQDVHFL